MPSRSFREWLLFATASAAVATATLLDPRGFRRHAKLREEMASLARRNDDLSRENAQLAREVVALQHDRRYQERAAREELGYVRPGQLLLELDEERGTAPRAPVLVGAAR